MCSRFQTGSNIPFEKRSARMFCTVSLPRKWSIRKICDSSKTPWTIALSARAEARSVPNGFSRMTRPSPVRPLAPSASAMPAKATGGTER